MDSCSERHIYICFAPTFRPKAYSPPENRVFTNELCISSRKTNLVEKIVGQKISSHKKHDEISVILIIVFYLRFSGVSSTHIFVVSRPPMTKKD